MNLYWWDARVHMELEVFGRIEIHWEIESVSVRNWQSNGLETPNQWKRTILDDAGINFPHSIGDSNAGTQ